MNLKLVVYVNLETGKISRISLPNHNIEPEGISDDGTTRVVHIFEGGYPEGCEDLRYFLDYHWYNEETNSFEFIGLPPNRHALWNATEGWTWDFELLLKDVVLERNRFLLSSDWTQAMDVPLTESKLQEWRVYRQQLRDLPDNVQDNLSSVAEVVWPTIPE
tara:strand:+ start:2791 stop:3273 length:483 start_codon:yes stop_codon:yes gene_type:complete